MDTPANSASETAQSPKRRPRVLIAEDNPTIQELIGLCLQNSCDLILANSGAKGWELIQQEPPDAIITDIMMQGAMDGNALIKAVKSDANLRSIPVLVISARTQQADIELSLGLGADGYITKPFSPFKLISWIGERVASR